jgi:hypothetical protein
MNKYTMYISLALNGILLMSLLGIIPFLLYLSVLAILGMSWYIRKTLEKSNELEEDIIGLVKNLDDFSQHLEDIHALEMYYGDENLQKLIEHSRNLVNAFIDFQTIYFDVNVQEADIEENTEKEEEDAEEKT